MTSYNNFIGIDIGKFEFVAAVHGSKATKGYVTDKKGFKNFCKDYREHLKNCLVVLESTGGYENSLLLYLIDNGISVHRADTRKVKNFIRSFGKHAKTDSIDALALAKYGFERTEYLALYTPPSPQQQTLKLLVERRQDLTKMLVQEKNRAQAPLNGPIVKDIKKVVTFLEKQIQAISEDIETTIKTDPELVEKRLIILDIPGIGDITANALITHMPELGQLNRREVASLSGLAPHPKESGTKTWYRRTIGGRRNLRPILFMAAMAASKTKTPLGEFYRSLIKRGKKPIVAQVALMRKIIVIANAKIRDYQRDSPQEIKI